MSLPPFQDVLIASFPWGLSPTCAAYRPEKREPHGGDRVGDLNKDPWAWGGVCGLVAGRKG